MFTVDFQPSFCKVFLKRTPSFDENFDSFVQIDKSETDFIKIRCPLCCWQPNADSRWFCANGGFPEFYFNACYTSWNTFDTRGVCPKCRHQWRYTTCLRCGENSLHEDWYEKREK